MEHEVVEHGAEHESSGFPPFDQLGDYGISQVFWLVVTFAVLFFAVTYWLLPKIKNAIEGRDAVIAADVAAAAAASATADAATKELEASIASAKARARATASTAKSEADKTIAAETAKADAALAKDLAAAEARIGEVRTKAMANVAGVAEDAAIAIAEKLAGVKPSPDAAKAAVKRALGG